MCILTTLYTKAQNTELWKAVSFDSSLSTTERWKSYKTHIKKVTFSYPNVLSIIHIHLQESKQSSKSLEYQKEFPSLPETLGSCKR